MKVRLQAGRAGWWLYVALAGLPAWAAGAGLTVDSHAQMRAAMDWLATPWSDAQQEALQAGRPPVDPMALMHVPGSARSYTQKQLQSQVPDWWPQDHPRMPAIVARGDDKAMPCAECHGPTGTGISHTATLTGLPSGYIQEQFRAFRDGSRANDEMHVEATHVDDADLKQAAAYFSALHLASSRVRIVQTARVPKTHVESWMLLPDKGGQSEPIGDRIIELPINPELVEMGDGHARFVAYVPPGSLARGRLLASTGAGKTTGCTTCHGPDLHGVADIPPLAGRSPTYLTRQLVQFALGYRHSEATLPMQQVVSRLTLKDMISVSAYAASLKP